MSKELKKWMPMFWGDYFAKTRHLTTTEHGAYLLLIGYYWTKGSLPNDERQLARIAGCTFQVWNRISGSIKPFFNPDWTHDRIEAELAYAIEKSKRLSANAKLRLSIGKASADTPTPTPTPTKKERKTPAAKEPPEFNDFWMSVPKREGSNPRIPALKSYQKAIRDGADPAQINAAAKRWARESLKTEPKFVAMAVTWLNQKRFEDYHVKPEAESNVVFDEATKLWEFREGYEPTDEEREAHAKYRRTAIATRFP